MMEKEQEKRIIDTEKKDIAWGKKGFYEVNRKQDKHLYTEEHSEQVKEFFKNYNPNIEDFSRYAGTVANKPNLPSKKMMKAIWEEFVEKERVPYIDANNTFSVEDIIRIGIDKFVVTNGWTRRKEVADWRKNVVRIGVCPHCKDQFVPRMYQINYGLCRLCLPKYSSEAIRKYLEYVATTNERYMNAMNDLMMDFFIMFSSDDAFRELFVEGSQFATDFKDKEFEVADWLKELQKKELKNKGVPVIDIESEEV